MLVLSSQRGSDMLYSQEQKEKTSIEQGSLEVPCELTFLIPNGTKDNETIISKLSYYMYIT